MIKKLFAALSLCLIFSSTALAGPYDIREMTPEIESAFQARQNRYGQLQNLKAAGLLGETNRGYVEALKSDADANAVAASENQDRRTIYQAIVQQNGFGPSGMTQVEAVFADVQREKARPGDFVQSPSGAWKQK